MGQQIEHSWVVEGEKWSKGEIGKNIRDILNKKFIYCSKQHKPYRLRCWTIQYIGCVVSNKVTFIFKKKKNWAMLLKTM